MFNIFRFYAQKAQKPLYTTYYEAEGDFVPGRDFARKDFEPRRDFVPGRNFAQRNFEIVRILYLVSETLNDKKAKPKCPKD